MVLGGAYPPPPVPKLPTLLNTREFVGVSGLEKLVAEAVKASDWGEPTFCWWAYVEEGVVADGE